MTRVVVIDNFDSFTYNLVDYLSVHADTEVYRNDVGISAIEAAEPDAIVISPGPGHPATDRDVGVTIEALTTISQTVPTLGVCLGLEAAVYAYGGTVDRAPAPVHGKASSIEHDGQGLFAGLEPDFRAGRYHSLAAVDVPDCFTISATAVHDGTSLVMGIRHRDYPIWGVQFHPESVLTPAGHDLIRNFLDLVAHPTPAAD